VSSSATPQDGVLASAPPFVPLETRDAARVWNPNAIATRSVKLSAATLQPNSKKHIGIFLRTFKAVTGGGPFLPFQ
jgi:hypothetical protein